ncbi:putative quinol monooxygenase [Microbacterium lacus]|uniref:ABM domain-containing protein n=1 Tax=Microbacterium lacus TaxID=415217 RepID=A0ABN2G2Y2_9MICO
MSAFSCNALWVARDGEAERVRGFLTELIAASRSEPGNLSYQAFEDAERPGAFRIFEVYRDERAFQDHAASDHFQRLAQDGAVPLLEERERSFGELIEL